MRVPDEKATDTPSVLLLAPDGKASRDPTTVIDDVRETNVLIVTVTQSPDEVLWTWRESGKPSPADLGIVAVGETTRTGATVASRTTPGPDPVCTIESVDDLAAVRTAVACYLDEWEGTDERIVLWFDSLTAVLQEVNVLAAFTFLQVLSIGVEAADATGYFLLDPTAHECRTIRELSLVCDAIGVAPVAGETWRCLRLTHDPITAPTGGNRRELSDDELFDLLSHPRRRWLLYALLHRTDLTTVMDLADALATVERSQRTGPGRLEQVAITLHHTHLPKLAKAGVIAYDRDRNRIELRDAVTTLELYLTLVDGLDSETHGSPIADTS